jgi:squalene synthase HpnC
VLELTGNVSSQPPGDPAAQRRLPDTALSGENFPVALRILPGTIRRHLLALYGYARYVDDLGDEPTHDDPGDEPAHDDPGDEPAHTGQYDDPVTRSAALRRFEDELRAMYAGRPPSHPVLVKLAPTVADRRLPLEPLRRLIAANQRDQVVHRYDTYQSLVDYCHLSADPVGELVLHIFQAESAQRIALSNHICTALQVIEHLQDVAEDYARDRIYLPQADLTRYGVQPEELAAPYASGPLRAVIRLQADRAAAALDTGAPLIAGLHGWARLAVAGYLAGGRAALAALARQNYDPLARVPRPTRSGIAGQWLKTLMARSG